MIDASRESFDENVRKTRDIVLYPHARGVHVEAELGTLGGIEDLGEQSARSMLTDPDQAVRFAAQTEVDAFAVAIGTSHGAYKFKTEPHLDFARLQQIASRVAQPMVLHGASSLPADDVRLAERFGAQLPHAQGIPADHPNGGDTGDRQREHRLRSAAGGASPFAADARGMPDLFNLYELMG